jgi:hypothetical protein
VHGGGVGRGGGGYGPACLLPVVATDSAAIGRGLGAPRRRRAAAGAEEAGGVARPRRTDSDEDDNAWRGQWRSGGVDDLDDGGWRAAAHGGGSAGKAARIECRTWTAQAGAAAQRDEAARSSVTRGRWRDGRDGVAGTTMTKSER